MYDLCIISDLCIIIDKLYDKHLYDTCIYVYKQAVNPNKANCLIVTN